MQAVQSLVDLDDTAEAKKKSWEHVGSHVVDSPAEIGKKSKRSFRLI
jgi:hypothetical protein